MRREFYEGKAFAFGGVLRIAVLAVVLILLIIGSAVTVLAEESFTGIKWNKDNGKWEYYKNGNPDYKFTGIATSAYDGKNYVAVKGVVDFNFTGVAKNPDTGNWEYVRRGKANSVYSGMAKSIWDGQYYFVRDGKVDFTYTGIAWNPETKAWEYAKKGKVNYKYKGAAKSIYDGEYYYCNKGVVDFTFTGLCYSPDHKTYIYVVRGKNRKTYTGPSISSATDMIYHVADGIWDKANTGTYKDKKNEYSIVRGRLSKSVVNIDGTLKYVNNVGQVVKAGAVKAQTGKYYFVNPKTGAVDVNKKEGFFNYDGKRYYSVGGGEIKGNQLFKVNNVVYGATADASLAESGWQKTGRLYYKFDNYSPTETSLKAMKILKSVDYDLYKAYMWSASLPYYRFSAKASWGTDWFAGYGFDQKRGNCYVMAGTFYYFAKELGYEVKQLEGYVDVIHSWDEIVHDGKTYVYDPCYDYETNDTAYKITYGQSGKWWYNSYHYMTE